MYHSLVPLEKNSYRVNNAIRHCFLGEKLKKHCMIVLNLLKEWDIVDSHLHTLKTWENFGEFESVFEILMFKLSLTFAGV